MSHITRIRTLKSACIFTGAFAFLMVLSLLPGLSGLTNIFLDLIYLPMDGQQTLQTESDHLLLAISGGLLLGLAVAFWQITTLVYTSDPVLGRRLILPTIFSWFVLDSLGSALAGAWLNIAFNLIFLGLFAVPVLHQKTRPLKITS